MNTLQIECFLSVARNHSFSGAARERYISQPTISKHIRTLEEELGATLFKRDYMCVTLTQAGEIYYRIFHKFLSEIHQAKLQTKQFEELVVGTIRLGLLYGWNLPQPLMEGIDDFQSHFPNVKISIENHGFRDLISRLNSGMIDACIHLQDFLDLIDNIQVMPLLDIPKYLIYNSKLAPIGADQRTPEPRDFAESTCYCVAEQSHSPTANRLVQYCTYYGFVPRTVFLPNIESVLSNIVLGNGFAILDGFTQVDYAQNLERILIQPPHRASMAWLKTSTNELLPLFAEELNCFFRHKEQMSK